MAPFLYRCPNTGFRVQGFGSDKTSQDKKSDDAATYVSVTCIMCQQVHLVNPTTGKVLGEDDEQRS